METSEGLPSISVIVPNYNQGLFLAEALESIVAQHYPRLEIIVIDGGSTDSSLQVLENYSDRLHFVCSEPDCGQYDAINKGFARATGDVLAYLNSDDKYFPDCLAVVGAIFARFPEVSWLTSLLPAVLDYHGGCIDVLPQRGYSREAFRNGAYGGGRTIPSMFIQQESTFWRRALWEKAGSYINDQMAVAADFELWSRFYQHATLWGVKSLFAGFRKRSGQRSEDYGVYARECAGILRQSGGTENARRKFLLRWSMKLRLHHLPVSREIIQSRLGYRAANVVRTDADRADASWELRRESFVL